MERPAETDEPALRLPGVVEEPCGLYPGLDAFSGDYRADDYCDWVEQSNGEPLPSPLALYIQDSCDASGPLAAGGATANAARLRAIGQELKLQGALVDSDRSVRQLVCAGSIADAWTDDQLYRLVSTLRDCFSLDRNGPSSWCMCLGTQIPPPARLRLLGALGFTRVRLALIDGGVGLDALAEASEAFRQVGIRKLVFDLLHDTAPAPTVPLERLLARVRPERIRLFGHDTALQREHANMLSALGYSNIGLNWFLLPDDPLVQAKAAGRLDWSLLGYTDMHSPDVIGIGPGALSSIGEFYGLNETRWKPYQALVAQGRLPIVRGIELEPDDVLRRELMRMILAEGCIRTTAIEEKWGIRFRQFFAAESGRLRALEQQGWIEWQADLIRIGVTGSHELTELCRIFDSGSRERPPLPPLSPA